MMENKDLLVKFSYYRKMLYIHRIPGVFKTRPYNLAEHSFFVAQLFVRLCKLENIPFSASDLEAVMSHDLLETVTADLPYHVKNLNDSTKLAWKTIEDAVMEAKPSFKTCSDEKLYSSLGESRFLMFKVCDLLELWIFCKEEVRFGNNGEEIMIVIKNCERIISDLVLRGNFKTVHHFMEEFYENPETSVS